MTGIIANLSLPQRIPEARNHIIAQLGRSARFALERVLEPVEFAPDTTLFQRGRIDQCLFVEGGTASLLYELPGKRPAGVGVVGPDGMFGLSVVLGSGAAEHTAVTLTSCNALSVAASEMHRLSEGFPSLRRAVLQYANERMTYVMRIAACHLHHRLEQRLAGLILRATDLLGVPEIAITHRQLALMLGVTRASATLSVHVLEGHRAIWSRRNLLVIRDRAVLHDLSCGCHPSTEVIHAS